MGKLKAVLRTRSAEHSAKVSQERVVKSLLAKSPEEPNLPKILTNIRKRCKL